MINSLETRLSSKDSELELLMNNMNSVTTDTDITFCDIESGNSLMVSDLHDKIIKTFHHYKNVPAFVQNFFKDVQTVLTKFTDLDNLSQFVEELQTIFAKCDTSRLKIVDEINETVVILKESLSNNSISVNILHDGKNSNFQILNNGVICAQNSLSTGEQARVDMAVYIGLRKIILKYRESYFPPIILDETVANLNDDLARLVIETVCTEFIGHTILFAAHQLNDGTYLNVERLIPK